MQSALVQGTTYRRPPITEAVIEFRFREPIGLERIEKSRDYFSSRFPIITRLNTVDIEISSDSKNNHSISGYVNGYRMDNVDSSNILIITNELIAYSRLAPYDGWRAFSSSAVDVLSDLRREAGFVPISRLGVRYVNRIDVPVVEENETFRIEDFLTIHPEYPEGALPPLRTYTMQNIFLLIDAKCLASITTASVASPVPRHSSLILDTDLGRTEDVPQHPQEIRKVLDVIRTEKNRMFEACITERTRELFK